MAEITGVQEPLANIVQSRTAIIDSVLENGLKPSEKLKDQGSLHLPSVDREPYSQVEGCVLHPRSAYGGEQSQFSTAMKHLLYAGARSILPVMMERDFDRLGLGKVELSDDEKSAIGRRMQSSFLVVYPINTRKMAGPETMSEAELQPDLIKYVIFPEDVYKQYKGVTKREIGPHKIVGNVVKNIYRTGIYAKPDSLTVPDYEKALEEIANEITQPVWVHGVRLPTEEDIRSLNKQDFGFRNFLEKEGDRYQISQRTVNGLTVFELKGLEIDQDIDVVLSNGKVIGVKEKVPDKVAVTIIDGDIRTYSVQRAGRVLTFGICLPVDYLRGEYIWDQNNPFEGLLRLNEWPWIGAFYTIKDGAGFKPELKINSGSFDFDRSIAVFTDRNQIWFGPEKREFPVSHGDKVYSLSKSSGDLTVKGESSKEEEITTFPEFISQKEMRELEGLLGGTDLGWLDLPRVMPILAYTIRAKQKEGN